MTFETFPYTNFQDLNIDWVLKTLKDALERIKTLEDVDIKEEIKIVIQQMIDDGELDDLLDALLADIRAQILALQQLTASHTLSINSLTTSQAEQDTLIADIIRRLSAAETAIEELRAAIQILDPTGEIGDIAERVVALEQALQALQVTVTLHTTQITQILQRLEALEGGAGAPLYLQYESRDISAMSISDIVSGVQQMDGSVKVGNFWAVTYTDPETAETATAELVIADIRDGSAWVVIRNTKAHAYNSAQFVTNAGYAYADIRTYADLLGEAVYTALGLSPIYRTYPIWSQARVMDRTLLPEISDQSHCCLLLSSMAYFGAYLFGTQYGAFDHKLPLYDHEPIPHEHMLYDYIVAPSYAIGQVSAMSTCRTRSRGLLVPYAECLDVGTTTAQLADYAIRIG